jgi:hypothetical protein
LKGSRPSPGIEPGDCRTSSRIGIRCFAKEIIDCERVPPSTPQLDRARRDQHPSGSSAWPCQQDIRCWPCPAPTKLLCDNHGGECGTLSPNNDKLRGRRKQRSVVVMMIGRICTGFRFDCRSLRGFNLPLGFQPAESGLWSGCLIRSSPMGHLAPSRSSPDSFSGVRPCSPIGIGHDGRIREPSLKQENG